MNKHTPAPWEIRGNKIFVPNTYRSIAIVCVQDNFDFFKWKQKEDIEAIANAKLIAAAPELLDYINRLCGEMLRNDFVLDEKWYMQGVELIKKATE